MNLFDQAECFDEKSSRKNLTEKAIGVFPGALYNALCQQMLNHNNSEIMHDSEKVFNSDLREPLPGYWYINHAGRLIRVRFVAYGEGGVERILIQDIEGAHLSMNIQDWHDLDLVVPTYEKNEMLLGSDNSLQ